MPAQTLFMACNLLALSGWLLLIFAPKWQWSVRVAAIILPCFFGMVYLYLLVVHFQKEQGGFGSLVGWAQFFQNPYLALAGWIHYLAFDLFIGSWEVRDAQHLGIRPWVVVPCLVLTQLSQLDELSSVFV